jgi:hypothetical protein
MIKKQIVVHRRCLSEEKKRLVKFWELYFKYFWETVFCFPVVNGFCTKKLVSAMRIQLHYRHGHKILTDFQNKADTVSWETLKNFLHLCFYSVKEPPYFVYVSTRFTTQYRILQISGSVNFFLGRQDTRFPSFPIALHFFPKIWPLHVSSSYRFLLNLVSIHVCITYR